MKSIIIVWLLMVSTVFGSALQIGNDIDGEALGDWFGSSVALSSDGSIIAIGAHNNDENGSNAGYVRLFKWNGSSWNQLGSDIGGEAEGDRFGISVSLCSDGSIVAIGAPWSDNNGSNSGHVRLYQWNGVNWNQLGSDIDGEAFTDYSGYSVALSSDGSIVAIGALYNDGNGSNSGHVRLYQWNGVNWNQLGSDIDGEASNDSSGISVALSSDGFVVAIGAECNGSNSGHVRLYQWNGSSWNQLGSDIDGEAEDDYSGKSVALSSDGSIVAIGAPANDGNGSDSGHVRIYQWNGSSWNQLGSDIDGEFEGDLSGYSVALSSDGSIVAIGAHRNDGNGFSAGHVRIYQWNGLSWNQQGSDIDGESSGDYSGRSVALSSDGSIVAIGAVLAYIEQSYLGAGHVRVYSRTSDADGDGLSDYDETNIHSTDPNNVDSDGDGLNDRDEVIIHSTDPNNVDSDGDGLNDRDEIIHSSNPKDADSDDDGLNDAYEVNISYTSPNSSDTDGDGLDDPYEINLSNTNPNSSDTDGDGLDDPYEINLSNTNPNDADSDDDGLNDGYEVNTSSTNPNNLDSDSDELNDGYEVNTSSTNPNDADSDDDGLNDGNEVNTYSTNPNDADSDDDGLNDGDEIANGTDPLKPTFNPMCRIFYYQPVGEKMEVSQSPFNLLIDDNFTELMIIEMNTSSTLVTNSSTSTATSTSFYSQSTQTDKLSKYSINSNTFELSFSSNLIVTNESTASSSTGGNSSYYSDVDSETLEFQGILKNTETDTYFINYLYYWDYSFNSGGGDEHSEGWSDSGGGMHSEADHHFQIINQNEQIIINYLTTGSPSESLTPLLRIDPVSPDTIDTNAEFVGENIAPVIATTFVSNETTYIQFYQKKFKPLLQLGNESLSMLGNTNQAYMIKFSNDLSNWYDYIKLTNGTDFISQTNILRIFDKAFFKVIED